MNAPTRPLWKSLLISSVTLLGAAGIVAGVCVRQQEVPVQRLQCADLAQGCTLQTRNGTVEIRSSERIQAMLPIELSVTAPKVTRVEASFAMVNMDMGFNRYTLKRDAAGIHRARITLPFCISGRGDWLLSLDLDGARVEIPFTVENAVNMQ